MAAPTTSERRPLALLGAGAVLGLAAAAVGLMRGPEPGAGLPEGIVASVNGERVRVEEYQRAVQALASDRRSPIGDAEKRHVLDRLLDEELLVQRGVELGLVRHDRRVRGDIVSAVIQVVVQQTEAEEPTADDLERFYADNRDYFARTGRLFVRQVLVRVPPGADEDAARRRAGEAAERLRAGHDFADVDEALGDTQVARLPADYLPAVKLREYVGPTATRTAMGLEPGQVSDPVRSASGYHVLQLVDREEGRVPPLSEIESEVRSEWVRRAGDEALRRYLDELRERADVRTLDALP
ncbi:MAG: peptidylprolyl isomerase [Myxococcota bacterium]